MNTIVEDAIRILLETADRNAARLRNGGLPHYIWDHPAAWTGAHAGAIDLAITATLELDTSIARDLIDRYRCAASLLASTYAVEGGVEAPRADRVAYVDGRHVLP